MMQRKLFCGALVAIATVSTAFLPAAAGEFVSLSGRVSDRAGDPIAGAHLHVYSAYGDREIQSNPRGEFALVGIEPSLNTRIDVIAQGYQPAACRVMLDPGHAPKLDIFLPRTGMYGGVCKVIDLSGDDSYNL